MLLLTDDDVRTAFSGRDAMREAIDIVERSFAAAYQGEASARSMLLTHPESSSFHDRPDFVLSATWGIWPAIDAAGGRMMELRSQDRGKSTVGTDTLQYWRPVWSTSSGELIALIVDAYAEQLLVGGHVGVATRHLARTDSSSLGLLGSGGLAGPCLEAVCATRPITSVKVYSPTARNREHFATEWSDRLSIEVTPVDSAREACRGVDIITTATNAQFGSGRGTAVVSNDWIAPGTHINAIASFETDRDLHLRAKVVPSSTVYVRDQGIPVEPTTSMLRAGEIPDANLPGDLVEVVGRGLHVRSAPDDVTLYIGPSVGFQHAGINRLVVDRARACGVGAEWDPISGALSSAGRRPDAHL